MTRAALIMIAAGLIAVSDPAQRSIAAIAATIPAAGKSAPLLASSTLWGGSGSDFANAIARDSAGNIVVVGWTTSTDFPIIGAPRSSRRPNLRSDAFVVKLTPDASGVIFSTNVGGSEDDYPTSVAVSETGDIYVGGHTTSGDFPLTVAGPRRQSADAFVFRLSANGDRLHAARVFGGSDYDTLRGLAIDAAGDVFAVGSTESAGFPVVNALQPRLGGGRDAFVSKLRGDSLDLEFSTFLGGSQEDSAWAVTLDDQQRVVLTGYTSSSDFVGATGPGGNTDAIVVTLDRSGDRVVRTIRVGGASYDQGKAIAATGDGGLVIAGSTHSSDFPLANPIQTALAGPVDGFVVQFDRSGSIVRSTYIGGRDYDDISDVAVRPDGSIAVSGTLYGLPRSLTPTLDQRGAVCEILAIGESASRPCLESTTVNHVTGFTFGQAHGIVLAGTDRGVWRSADGGRTWQQSVGMPPDHVRAIASEGGLAVAAMGQQVYRSTDGGITWTAVDLVASVTGLSVSGSVIYAVGSSGGKSLDAGANWTPFGGGLFSVSASPTNPSLVIVGSSTFDYALISTDGGKTWGRRVTLGDDDDAPVSVAVHPRDASLFYASGRDGLARTTGGSAWTRVPGAGGAFAVDPLRPGYVFANSNSLGGLSEFRPDGTATRLPIQALISAVAVDPTDGRVFGGRWLLESAFVLVLPTNTSEPPDLIVLGGIRGDQATGCIAADDGSIVMAGSTSVGFPTVGSLQHTPAAPESFASKAFITRVALDGDGDRDGLVDTWERQFGLNPALQDANEDPDGDGLTNAEEARAGTHPRGIAVRHFAEGVQSDFFATTFSLLNPDRERTATVLLRFVRADARASSRLVVLPPLTRRTLGDADLIGIRSAEFSTVVESDVAVAVDRAMTWNADGYGSHADNGTPAPSTDWYFAEGATRPPFELYYLLSNPSERAADLQVTYYRPSPAPPVVRRHTVPPFSRGTIAVHREHATLASAEISAAITSTNGVRIVAERAMYLSSPHQPFAAGHASSGLPAPRTNWYFAEGATGSFFDAYLLVLNPNAEAAIVRFDYFLPGGQVVTRTYGISGQSRFTVSVDDEDAALADTAFAARVSSNNGVPVVVERTMWWPGPTPATWHEGHGSAGLTSPALRWGLADGLVDATTDAYVLIANPGGSDARVSVTLVFDDGAAPVDRTFLVGPLSRRNVAVASDFPSAFGRRFSLVVESLTTSRAATPIVVEGASYSDSGAVRWAAGSARAATPLPDRQ